MMSYPRLGIGSVSISRLENRGVYASTGNAMIKKLTIDVANENPLWTSKRIATFLAADKVEIPNMDLSVLKDKVTLV